MDVTTLARPEIVAMRPYASARSSMSADGILLNANEAPHVLLDEPDISPLNQASVVPLRRSSGKRDAASGVPDWLSCAEEYTWSC